MDAQIIDRPSSGFWRTTRRGLLIGGGATLGLAVGWAVWPREERMNLAPRAGTNILNSWLRVANDGRVIVICPQAEMGQGTHTGFAQIVADELGADWRTVEVEPAPLNPTYANRKMLNDALEPLPAVLQGVGAWATGEIARRFDLQLTGGSTSIRSYDETLRHAAASARTMLVMAAARRWEMDWEKCRTERGFVIGGANQGRFADFAAAAAAESPPDTPQLKPVKGVGTARSRLDVPAKVDGSAVYGLDVRLPGMIYAAIRHGPAGDRGEPELSREVPEGAIAQVRGPGWAAVVAERWYAAKGIAEALEPKFRATAGLADSKAIGAAIDSKLAAGDVLGGEGRLIEARYDVPYAAHAALEPQNATARVVDGRAEVWTPTQSTSVATSAVARALGIPEAAVTIYPTLLGGGFGRKVETDAAVQAALIARDVKRPVQLIWSREEEMRAAPLRPAAGGRLQARLGLDGQVSAFGVRIACQSPTQSFMLRNLPGAAFGIGDPDPSALEGASSPLYAFGRVEAEHALVEAPVAVTFWRSVSNSYTGFFVECFVDELAKAAGSDPLRYRLGMLTAAPRARAVLEAAAAKAGYRPGMGVALHRSFGTIVAVVAEVALKPEPQVRRLTMAVDCGRAVNPNLVRQQMEGSAIWALTSALKAPITFADGYPEQSNFADYPLLTLAETPAIDVVILSNPDFPLGGVGEPGVPPVAPAVANAFALTAGKPFRRLPLELS